MIKTIHNVKGQAALLLILVTAASLIFMAIALNWGRIAQVKALLSVAADEATSQLASDAASYGEMQKQTYLHDKNQLKESTGIFLAIIMVIIAIIVTIFSWGSGTPFVLALLAVVLAVTNLVLQVVVLQPMITSLWNKLQQNQPIQQQFYEQAIASALQGSVTDQVTIGDYLDSNANGVYGLNTASNPPSPNDYISRFALFYTDRLKMLNQKEPLIPQVVFFYNQLNEFMNGETCSQNESDCQNYSFLCPSGVNPFCLNINASPTYCINSTDPACGQKIPAGFQLNDSCPADYNTGDTSYNPYCDPCCQAPTVPDSNPAKALRPSSCSASYAACDTSPPGAGCPCLTNNPYNAYGSYPYLYDASFQNYNAGLSFLDKYGRDQQLIPPGSSLPVLSITPMSTTTNGLNFPNGIFGFFWLMTSNPGLYSPEVDNISASAALQPSQYHWCVAGSSMSGGTVPTVGTPAGFPDLAQLSLPYTCQGQDCCVNHVVNAVSNSGTQNSNTVTVTLTAGPAVSIASPANGSYLAVGSNVTFKVNASESGGTIQSVSLYVQGAGAFATLTTAPYNYTETVPNATGAYVVYATATDSNNVTAQSASVTLNIADAPVAGITTPTSGESLTAGSTFTISATASTGTQGASISSVSFYNDGQLLGTVNSSPFNYQWTVPNTPGATYSLTAVAKDSNGMSSPPSQAVGGSISS